MLVFIMRVERALIDANGAIYKFLKNDKIYDFIDFFTLKIDEFVIRESKK